MTDETLLLLADDEWDVLDLAGCGRVCDGGLAAALAAAPRLRALDLSRCSVTAAALRQLPHLCPVLECLRLGALAVPLCGQHMSVL